MTGLLAGTGLLQWRDTDVFHLNNTKLKQRVAILLPLIGTNFVHNVRKYHSFEWFFKTYSHPMHAKITATQWRQTLMAFSPDFDGINKWWWWKLIAVYCTINRAKNHLPGAHLRLTTTCTRVCQLSAMIAIASA